MKKPIKLNLPKKYLSWSQYNLWKRDKEGYRKLYYFGVQRPENAEMRYGDTVARMLESGMRGKVIDKIPRYQIAEYKIETEIMGVPVLAFIDSFDPIKNRFLEYKTGHLDKSGKVPWNAVKVRKHGQLPFYAAAITALNGKCHPIMKLVWIETEKKPLVETFGKLKMESVREGKLRLTGKIKTFPRTISKWEITRISKDIRKVAEEISKDYSKYEKDMLGK